ncbi:hypothetical protein NP233_g5491 [Leucocoprinus birnbaumii]|uniref:Transmembrane protein n=1 Tax=Leucocoprinus birnbaumii TaxID=56174 RepID=A0AAD5VSS2_9AGAR|nr:hypothetical protein NP233_g5491 [Leucocoprinus birnbaumii]
MSPQSFMCWVAFVILAITYFILLFSWLWDTLSSHLPIVRCTYSEWKALFVGTLPWRQQYECENRLVRRLRGSGAILFVALAGACGFYAVVVKPVGNWSFFNQYEMAHFVSPPSRYAGTFANSIPSIIMVTPGALQNPTTTDRILSANISSNVLVPYDCVEVNLSDIPISAPYPSSGIRCDSADGDISNTSLMADDGVGRGIWSYTYTIEFSGLPMSLDSAYVAFYLFNGPASSTQNIIENTDPVILQPGDRLRGTPQVSIRQIIVNRGAAAFAVTKRETSWAWHIRSLNPDQASNLKPLSSTQASLRIIPPPVHPKVVYQRETAQYTFLGGLSFAGGVWTTLNGTFAAIFGSTLFLVMFGIKPLSVYGLVHLMYKKRPELISQNQELSDEEMKRIIRIVREHLLDADHKNENLRSGGGDGNSKPIDEDAAGDISQEDARISNENVRLV